MSGIQPATRIVSNLIKVVVALGDAVPGSHAERVCLLSLWADGEGTMGALCTRIDMSRGAMTTIVDRLERRGMVGRHLSRKDRRIIKVRITRAGREAVEAAIDTLPVPT